MCGLVGGMGGGCCRDRVVLPRVFVLLLRQFLFLCLVSSVVPSPAMHSCWYQRRAHFSCCSGMPVADMPALCARAVAAAACLPAPLLAATCGSSILEAS
jgi:hypothetical protein